MRASIFVIFSLLFLASCLEYEGIVIYDSEDLKITKIDSFTYIHTSYLETEEYGKVACNGMVTISGGEAFVSDTPTNNKSADKLIAWLQYTMDVDIIGVAITHFHEDCLGGILSFHTSRIPSYSTSETIRLCGKKNLLKPQIGFPSNMQLKLGDDIIELRYFGPGHTWDNIIVHFPKNKSMFGGCLVKSMDAGKGNLEDAYVDRWSNTIQKVKASYPDLSIVIPGHGKHGSSELLDYTEQLFDVNNPANQKPANN